MNPIKIVIISLFTFTIAACGGGGSPIDGSAPVSDREAGTGDGTGTGTVTSVSGRNVTFLPIAILETSSDYSGFSESNVFVTESEFPFIKKKMISIFDSATLEEVSGTIDDFVITENDKVISFNESFPILQTIGSIPTYLHTAIVIDASNSVAASVGYDSIIVETKAMITAMKASSDSVISNQRFSIWAFGSEVVELTDGFTADSTLLNSALDSIKTESFGIASNLNRAIVEAVGNYDGPGGTGSSLEFSFRDVVGFNNDLIEEITTDRIQLSSLILIASGTDNLDVFSAEQVKVALESQSQVIFDQEAGSSDTKNFGKPFITVLVDNKDGIDAVITDNASEIINLKNETGVLSYAAKVTNFQTALIKQRKREGNRNVLRYASPKRQGSHTAVVSTSAKNFTYSLTNSFEFKNDESAIEMPSALVEIAGGNNQYLQNVININNTNTFYPATRWTTETYSASDYVWELDDIVLLSDAATGAVVINSASIGSSATLSLTNSAIGKTKNIQLTTEIAPGILIYDDNNNRPLTGQSIARTDIQYVDLNEPDPDAEIDPVAPVIQPEEVYTVVIQDYNVPLESYKYVLFTPGWTNLIDFKIIGNKIQIHKEAIDNLDGPITITVENQTLVTTANFTITP
jgi:hypothetical protein